MTEFLREAVLTINLPITILMGMVTVYWLFAIIGGFGLDSFDLDLDIDADVDLDVDAGVDADASGFFGEFLAFMFLGKVPLVILFSSVIYILWFVTIVGNHYLNPEHTMWLALVFAVPNFVLSCLVTRLLISPFLWIFRTEESQVETRENMLGICGVVKTTEVNESFGQIEIQIDGPPMVINARSFPGEKLVKGDLAKIESYNPANDTYAVSLSKWEKK